MITKALHYILQKNLWLYEPMYVLGNGEKTRCRLAAQTASLNNTLSVLDLGGGTGQWRSLWPSACTYLCLEIDATKLWRFRATQKEGIGLYADALWIPIKDSRIDAIVCIAVSHHFSEDAFEQMLKESRRALKDTGSFLFLDAVWEPDRLASRLLWRYDRGSYPRTTDQLRVIISNYYNIVYEEEYSIYHKYFLCRGVK